ncbi:DNA-(apurinic or apyrimidinic site) lyase /endonuclease III [Peptostreptococcaceae bacterium pGA-8]|nr:DNA-(apurinic or apyrimidinic site) lyase /endonuclease III [Peptostreptococcaceae bacterium pGA-8]
MIKKSYINNILDILDEEYPEAECALDYQNVFQLLIAVVLSAQTTDVSVNKVTPKLFETYPCPEDLAEAESKAVEAILKTIGMYRTKAKNIINLSRDLVYKFGSKVPEDYDLLISLPGVGRKTANVVLSVGFGHERIAVDTHVFRVSNRIGLVKEKDVLATELSLMKRIDETRWSKTHHSLIFHGRNCCTARNPKCDSCPILELCERNL